MFNSAMLKSWRTSAAKLVGATAAVALGVTALVASPASAADPAGNDVRVFGWATGSNEGRVCVEFYEGHGEGWFPGYQGPALTVDEYASDFGATATINEIDPVDYSCDYEYTVSDIQTGVETQFRFDAWIIDQNGDQDGWGSGTTANETGQFGLFGQWVDDLRTDVGLAYRNDQIRDERHTAYLCVAPRSNEGDYYFSFSTLPTITVFDETTGEWVNNVEPEVYWSGDLEDPSCNTSDYPVEAYIPDLTLGHTYSFSAQAVTTRYYDGEGSFTDYYWSYSQAQEFTPLDIHSNQVNVYPTNNAHANGWDNYDTQFQCLEVEGCAANEIVRGDATSYTNDLTGQTINSGDDLETSAINYTNVDVQVPVSLQDGEPTNSNRYDTYADLTLYDQTGVRDYAGEQNLLELDGGCVWDNGDQVCPYQLDTEFGYEDAGRWGNVLNLEGQAFVTGYFYNEEGLYEGLSDNYSDNRDFNSFDSHYIRATSAHSLQLTLETNINTNVDESGWVDPATATYSIRALPNYGNGTVGPWYGPDLEYTGNHDEQRPVRYLAKDFTFAPGDYEVVHCYVEGEDTCSEKGAINFNLTGLDAATSYSFEIVANYPVDADVMDSTDNWNYGDGGYENVQIRDSVYWYGTTNFASSIQNVSSNYAEISVDITDSHFVDNESLLSANYLAVNECRWMGEGTSSGNPNDPNWDCSAIDPNSETSTRFATDHISRVQDGDIAVHIGRDGHRYAVVGLHNLAADTKYEVVFGADYYHTNLVNYGAAPFQFSNRQTVVDTLDGDTCDPLTFGNNWEAQWYGTNGGADCYNGTSANAIYRTDVQSFVTVENVAPFVVDAAIFDNNEGPGPLNISGPGSTGIGVYHPVLGFMFSEHVNINKIGEKVTLRNRETGATIEIPLSSADVHLENVEGVYSILYVQLPELAYGTDYEFEIPAGALVDDVGNAFAGVQAIDFGFQTEFADTTAPSVVAVTPVNGSTGVAVNSDLTVTFDELIQKGDNTQKIIVTNTDTGTPVVTYSVGSSKVQVDGNVAYIELPKLAYGTNYEVTVEHGAFTDAAGNESEGISGDEWSFQTEFNAPPTVVSTSPVDLATNVAVNDDFYVTFSEPVQVGTVGHKIIVWNADSGKAAVTVDVTSAKVTNVSGNQWKVELPKLDYLTNYYVTIDSGSFLDLDGNVFAGLNGNQSRFQTVDTDRIAPSVTSVSPANGSSSVSYNHDLTVVFDEAVVKGAVDKHIHIWDIEKGLEAATIDVSSDKVSISGNTMTINAPDFKYSTRYQITMDPGAVVDLAGNEFAGLPGSSWSFTTEATDTDAPLVTTTSPADGDTEVSHTADLTITFNEAIVKGGVGKAIKLWNAATGQVAMTVDVSASAVTIDNRTVTVALPDLDWSTNYYVTVDNGAFFDLNGNAFAGLAGADLEFQTEAHDVTPPSLVSIATKDDESNGVDTDTYLQFTFDENVVAGSAPIQLIRAGDDVVVQTFIPSASKNITISGNVVTITRGSWLDYNTEYYVYVPKGAFFDEAGNAFQGNDLGTETFTTELKPAYIGTVAVSASYNGRWRNFEIKMGGLYANTAYKLFRLERATDRLVLIRSGYLNSTGGVKLSANVNHLDQYDDVFVRIGRHYLAYSRVGTK